MEPCECLQLSDEHCINRTDEICAFIQTFVKIKKYRIFFVFFDRENHLFIKRAKNNYFKGAVIMKKKSLSFILTALMLTACGEKEQKHKSGEQRIQIGNIYENGMIYTAGETKRFLDFTSLETAPLCAVPNCTHSSSSGECLTRVINGTCMLVDDYLYYFTVNGNGGEMLATPDGYELYMESKLMRVSLDCSETETVCTFTDALARTEDTFLLIDDMLYFCAYDPDPKMTETGGYEGYGTSGGYDFLCSINLNTGEYTNYGYFCYVEDEYHAADDSATAKLKFYYKGKIMLRYSFLKEFPEFDENGIPLDDEAFIELWEYYTYEFNPETKEFTKVDYNGTPRFFENGYCIYDDKSPVITVVKDDETYTINGMWQCSIINDKAFDGQHWCNIGDDVIYELDEEYEGYRVVAFHDGKYVLFNNRKAIKLSEEELIENSKVYEEDLK